MPINNPFIEYLNLKTERIMIAKLLLLLNRTIISFMKDLWKYTY